MSGFYFSSVPKLKLRRGGVVDDILIPPSAPSTVSDPRVTILQVPEIMTGSPSFIPLAPEVISKVPPASFSVKPMPSSGSARQSGKRKAGAHSREEAFRDLPSPPLGKCEYINIGSRGDKLPSGLREAFTPGCHCGGISS
ncbi:hypothetical protein Fot_41767 [Forsythia ovata]|uniref:Uncharacterized protein n=1 Tax=Forsythia ovata TaxID=205694 RepID=A0ABD1RJ89_9LAMI